ncbi:MAG: HNH endonuclease [Cytophagales bacterium]|nr:MAG: HNH endonuclease [Cytophagales bacterium]TAF61719.1 MAG: HNH endonuclease [Cytophagales bacterium]
MRWQNFSGRCHIIKAVFKALFKAKKKPKKKPEPPKKVEAAKGVRNSKGVAYPKVVVEGFGEVPFPTGQISKVTPSPASLRSEFNKIRNSGEFRACWEAQGRPWPTPSTGSRIDIHHIQPLGYGGTNAFENLVPLDYNTQHKLFNSWWLGY